MANTTDEMMGLIAGALFKHQLSTDDKGRAVCKCGWFVTPLLNSVLRLHQADQILATVLLATAQIQGENIAESRSQAAEEWQKRTTAMGLLLLDSGDITPMGARMLNKIWEPVGDPG